jgi:hypothetical protein
MHPMERLRYVARASAVSPVLAVRETAAALTAFADDPQALTVACRRMIDRHPRSAPLWWLAARMLTAADPVAEARRAAAAIAADPTGNELRDAIPDGARVCVLGWPDVTADALLRRGDLEVFVVDVRGEGSALCGRLLDDEIEGHDVPIEGLGAAVAASDLVVLEAAAAGPTAALAVAGSRAAGAVARYAQVPVWLVVGVGRMLPQRLWDALVERAELGDEPWLADDELVPLDLVDNVVGPRGLAGTAAVLQQLDCPVAPELLLDRRDVDG